VEHGAATTAGDGGGMLHEPEEAAEIRRVRPIIQHTKRTRLLTILTANR